MCLLTSTGSYTLKCIMVDVAAQNQCIEEDTAQLLEEGTASQQRALHVVYGQVLRKREFADDQDDSINDDPLIVLMEYMRQKNMRLLDLFNSLDADGSKSLSRQEFKEGLQVSSRRGCRSVQGGAAGQFKQWL